MATSKGIQSALQYSDLYRLPPHINGMAHASFRDAILPKPIRIYIGFIAFLFGAWLPYIIMHFVSKSPFTELEQAWKANTTKLGLKRYSFPVCANLDDVVTSIRRIVGDYKNTKAIRVTKFQNTAFIAGLIRGGVESAGLTKLLIILKPSEAGTLVHIAAYKRYLAPHEADSNPILDSATYTLAESIYSTLTAAKEVADVRKTDAPIFPRAYELSRNRDKFREAAAELITPMAVRLSLQCYLISLAIGFIGVVFTVLLYLAALWIVRT